MNLAMKLIANRLHAAKAAPMLTEIIGITMVREAGPDKAACTISLIGSAGDSTHSTLDCTMARSLVKLTICVKRSQQTWLKL